MSNPSEWFGMIPRTDPMHHVCSDLSSVLYAGQGHGSHYKLMIILQHEDRSTLAGDSSVDNTSPVLFFQLYLIILSRWLSTLPVPLMPKHSSVLMSARSVPEACAYLAVMPRISFKGFPQRSIDLFS